MLYNITLNDRTQKILLKHLNDTHKLLSTVATNLSSKEKEVTIYAMPDLGISHNVTRMLGGFFTGMFCSWESDIPFIPVDGTVNVCGTAVFKLQHPISIDEFKCRIFHVLKDSSQYQWNFDQGNHFISLTKGDLGSGKNQYLVVHASACEYKKLLYPVPGNWFYNQIQTIFLPNSSKYLRYISGSNAEKFYALAYYLLPFNKKRNRSFCEKVLGNLLEEEVLNVAHYGMPNIHSLAIGCHFQSTINTLLTYPGGDIFIIQPHDNTVFTPHGFGLALPPNSDFQYQDTKNINIGTKLFSQTNSIQIGCDSVNRFSLSDNTLDEFVNKILTLCPGTIVGRLEQLCSYSELGFKVWKESLL